jgi:hypothetical protein
MLEGVLGILHDCKVVAPFFSLWYSCRVCNPRKFFWIRRAPWSILFLAFSSAATYKMINKNDKQHPYTRIENHKNRVNLITVLQYYWSCILNWILERMMKLLECFLYLSRPKKQFCVANLIHFWGYIELLQYSNWNTERILRWDRMREEKSVSADYYKKMKFGSQLVC